MSNKEIITEFHADLKRSGKMQEALDNLCEKACAEGRRIGKESVIVEAFGEEDVFEAGRQSAQKEIDDLKLELETKIYDVIQNTKEVAVSVGRKMPQKCSECNGELNIWKGSHTCIRNQVILQKKDKPEEFEVKTNWLCTNCWDKKKIISLFADDWRRSDTYKRVLNHRHNCLKWGKEFCLDCFGGGLTEFTDNLKKELSKKHMSD